GKHYPASRTREATSMDVVILVGTMTGNAQLVAQELELGFSDADTRIVVMPMDDLDPGVFERDAVFLVCTSTYGHGDVPDNARDLFDALDARRPDLSAVRYGVRALGDSSVVDAFAHGGLRFESAGRRGRRCRRSCCRR